MSYLKLISFSIFLTLTLLFTLNATNAQAAAPKCSALKSEAFSNSSPTSSTHTYQVTGKCEKIYRVRVVIYQVNKETKDVFISGEKVKNYKAGDRKTTKLSILNPNCSETISYVGYGYMTSGTKAGMMTKVVAKPIKLC